jgi:hypothetical protein
MTQSLRRLLELAEFVPGQIEWRRGNHRVRFQNGGVQITACAFESARMRRELVSKRTTSMLLQSKQLNPLSLELHKPLHSKPPMDPVHECCLGTALFEPAE